MTIGEFIFLKKGILINLYCLYFYVTIKTADIKDNFLEGIYVYK